MLGIGPRYSCKDWFVKHFAGTKLVYFLLIVIVFNNLENFKTNLSFQNFSPRSKNQLHFPSVKHTSVKKCVTYSARKNIY